MSSINVISTPHCRIRETRKEGTDVRGIGNERKKGALDFPSDSCGAVQCGAVRTTYVPKHALLVHRSVGPNVPGAGDGRSASLAESS